MILTIHKTRIHCRHLMGTRVVRGLLILTLQTITSSRYVGDRFFLSKTSDHANYAWTLWLTPLLDWSVELTNRIPYYQSANIETVHLEMKRENRLVHLLQWCFRGSPPIDSCSMTTFFFHLVLIPTQVTKPQGLAQPLACQAFMVRHLAFDNTMSSISGDSTIQSDIIE